MFTGHSNKCIIASMAWDKWSAYELVSPTDIGALYIWLKHADNVIRHWYAFTFLLFNQSFFCCFF